MANDRKGVSYLAVKKPLRPRYTRAFAKDEGLFHCLKIERLTGLRGQEALMSAGNLVDWCKSIVRDGTINVESGTKGGRSRVSALIEARTLETIEAIEAALLYAKKNRHFLIHGPSESLKSARSRYHRLCREIGLIEPYSPHSLRYAFAVEKLVELLDQGFGNKEACSIVSQLLGHGDGRGRWVRSVYCRTVDLPEKVKTTDLVNKLLTEAIETLKKRGKEF